MTFSRTWWGQKFIAVMEDLTDAGRLSRGRSYAKNGKIIRFEIEHGTVTANVRGSVNPYFGVYKEPLYTTVIQFQPISAAKWSAAIALIACRASLISRLLMNEIPDSIEDCFRVVDANLLPRNRQDFKAECSCPDWSNPCKHIAGVYYLLAAELDRDPFILFELRGLSREKLKAELARSPLGQALSAELSIEKSAPEPSLSYYTKPQTLPAQASTLAEFWSGAKRLPQTLDLDVQPAPVTGIVVKKQGDFPPFWHKDASFLAVMDELYERVKTKNRESL